MPNNNEAGNSPATYPKKGYFHSEVEIAKIKDNAVSRRQKWIASFTIFFLVLAFLAPVLKIDVPKVREIPITWFIVLIGCATLFGAGIKPFWKD